MLEENIVFQCNAIGDHQKMNPGSLGWPITAFTGIGADDPGQMGGVETDLIITGPNHFLGVQYNIRKCCSCMIGVRNDLFAALLQPIIVKNNRIRCVALIDVIHLPLIRFPDPVSDSDNVIDDVPVSRIETFEGLSGTKILRYSNRTVLGVMFQRNFIATGHVAAVQW